jgi:hypothetical protein
VKRLRLVAAVLTLLVAQVANAHQDRGLLPLPGGFLLGLPWKHFWEFRLNIEQYGTNRLRIETRVGDHVTTILPCATGLLRTRDMKDVAVSGSWYHDEVTLPYYVNVKLINPLGPDDRFGRSSINFLFDLRTGELVWTYRDGWKARDWSETTDLKLENCELTLAGSRPNNSLERSRER